MTNSTPVKFSDLALSEDVQQAIIKSGYKTPSSIQLSVIPELLKGKDILGIAQTGTGKTAAFALPILSKINIQQNKPQVLCLTPTRELAIQVASSFHTYAKNISGFSVLAVYGGTGYREQTAQLSKGVHVVVGTPGRLMDLIDRKKLKLDSIEILVLDEADEMLRMGFIDDVEWMLKHMPAQHQTALFSATMPLSIKKITQKYLNHPVEIMVKSKITAGENISQYFLPITGRKLSLLIKVLEAQEFEAVIIFTKTKNSCNEVAGFLQKQGFRADALNGDVAQDQREKIVTKLKRGDIDIIVATDVAARGLDAKRISLVINYDLPADVEIYIHRIGRTGRAGRTGDAILFIDGRRIRLLDNIEHATKQQIKQFKFPSIESLNKRKLTKIFTRIDTELQKDLTQYENVVAQYLTYNSIPVEKLAAAIASIEAKSKPFFITDLPKIEPITQGKNNPRNNKKSKARKQSNNKHQTSNINMENFLLNVGEEHNVKKSDIVGAIANEAGIDSKFIGKIKVFSKHSLIDLPQGMSDEIFQNLQNIRICGHKSQIKRANDSKQASKNYKKHRKLKSNKKTRPNKTKKDVKFRN